MSTDLTVLTFRAALCCGLGLIMSGGPVDAQTRRPARGVFGGDSKGASGDHDQMTLSLSMYEADDQNLVSDTETNENDRRLLRSGSYSGLNADLAFEHNGAGTSFDAGATTSLRYYRQIADGLVAVRHQASAGISTALGRGLRLHASQSVSYSPYFQFASLAGAAEPEPGAVLFGAHAALAPLPAYTYDTQVGATESFGARSSLSASYGLRLGKFTQSDADMKVQQGSARYTYQVTRYTSVHAGYGYRTGHFGLGAGHAPVRVHDLDVGLGYNRSITPSRRVTMSFGSGSSLVVRQEQTRFRLSGVGSVNVELGRGWTADVQYRRSVSYVEGFADPFLSDSVGANVGGLVGSRLHLAAEVDYNTGAVGLLQKGNEVNRYSGTARARFAVTRHLALFAQYFRFYSRFGELVDRPRAVPRLLDRSGVAAGLTVWVPFIESRRKKP